MSESRSVQRRKAVQRGEPMPEKSLKPEEYLLTDKEQKAVCQSCDNFIVPVGEFGIIGTPYCADDWLMCSKHLQAQADKLIRLGLATTRDN